MRSVCFYISGHGFGHASRQIEIINALGRLAPDVPIVVRTAAAPWLFERTARVPLTLLPGECDTGAVQIDSLRLDEDATISRAARFHDDLEARAGEEARLLRAHGAGLVLTDAPPLACAAAARAGVPAVVVANFTWDWIYEAYAPHPRLPALVERLAGAYAEAEEAWRLPFHGGFASCRGVRDVPLVARHATHRPEATRARLGLPRDRRLVLVSFGGFGVESLPLAQLDCLETCDVIVTHDGPLDSAPHGVHAIPNARLEAAGLRYEDLVAAADVVLTKPGYGIVSECIANGTAVLYTPRGRFAEYDVLTREMPSVLPCARIDHDALFAGRWQAALDDVASAPAAARPLETNGAEVIARLACTRLGGR